MAVEVSKFSRNADGFSESVQESHGMVESCSRPWTLETVCEKGKKPRVDVTKCLGDPSASSMACCLEVVASHGSV